MIMMYEVIRRIVMTSAEKRLPDDLTFEMLTAADPAALERAFDSCSSGP